jgi:predicted P-loop ATPase
MSGGTLDDWFDEDDSSDKLLQAVTMIEAKKVAGKDGGEAVWSTEEDGSEKAVVLADAWEQGLIRDAKGFALFNQYNVAHTLRECPEWDGVFAFNEFTGRKMVLSPIPGSRASKKHFHVRELADSDILTATAWFNRNRFPRAYKSVVADAIDEVIIEYRFNPVRDYLEAAASSWDGTPRMGMWLETYCGVQPGDPLEQQYVQEVAAKWLVSAVARVMEPGCKADGVLILEGIQGAGKSTAAKILAGPEFFGDNLPPMHTREASSYVRGRWIIELAELANVSKAEVEIVKAFISRTEERFRPAYGRNEVTYPRQCVFIGSTNRTDYLRDDTGNRRFWPVAIDRVDTAALARDRDQLWGEAVVAYRAGATWWLSEAVERVAQAEQKDRLLEDPWQADVLEKVAGETETCVPKIMAEMMIETGRRDRASSNRIVSILMQNGWIRDGRFTGGSWKGQHRYVPRRQAAQAAGVEQVAPDAQLALEHELHLDMEKDVF